MVRVPQSYHMTTQCVHQRINRQRVPNVPGTSIRLCGYSLLTEPFIHHPSSVCLDLPPNCAPIPSPGSGPALPSIASTVPHLTPAAQLWPCILSPWQQHFHNISSLGGFSIFLLRRLSCISVSQPLTLKILWNSLNSASVSLIILAILHLTPGCYIYGAIWKVWSESYY